MRILFGDEIVSNILLTKVFIQKLFWNRGVYNFNYTTESANGKDSDQPGHSRSLIGAFSIRMNNLLKYQYAKARDASHTFSQDIFHTQD